ncbi:hypothetical protein BWR19_13735 [Halomonas sp. 1513]|nr:PRC-barrel domain-containing protein [Halomonas sp. 1513]APX93912.1 hypothetical protein BWR19_13735 [Halomonas sp. 1513]
MKKLTMLFLSAAIVPAFALSTVAIAQDSDETRENAEQRDDQQRGDEQRADQRNDDGHQAGEQFMTRKPAGAIYADDMIGKDVKNRGSGDEIGEVQDLVIGEDGRIVGVVVTTGTILGLGGQEVSLNWDQLDHTIENDESVFYVDIDEDTLKNAPEHERN